MNHSAIWGITAYFNPEHYRRRRENFRVFRDRLGIPLLAVELSFDGRFELEDGDADLLLRLEDGDVLWQKERLINAGLRQLPAGCTAVACIDCDIIFGRDDWPQHALEMMAKFPVAQPFSRVHHLPAGWSPAADPTVQNGLAQSSVAFAMSHRGEDASPLGMLTQRRPGAASAGFAWVLRRDVLETHGLFDGCIAGGGDTALACAAWGDPDAVIGMHQMNAHQENYYRGWAQPFNNTVRSRVGCLEGALFHLWHGELSNRQSGDRHSAMRPFGFDPMRDLSPAAGGSWRWNSDKPQLHAYMREYFAARKEDG